MNPRNLRSSVIRLAHANPELRPHLLPLLVEGGRSASGLEDEFDADHENAELWDEYQVALEHFRELNPSERRMSRLLLEGWSPSADAIRKFRNPSGWGDVLEAVRKPSSSSPKDLELKKRLESTPQGKLLLGELEYMSRLVRYSPTALRWFHSNGYEMKEFDFDQK